MAMPEAGNDQKSACREIFRARSSPPCLPLDKLFGVEGNPDYLFPTGHNFISFEPPEPSLTPPPSL